MQFGSTNNDPTNGANPIVTQRYVTQNNFDNAQRIAIGSDGEWDIALNAQDNSGGNYCVRMVYNDGSLLDTYTQIPTLIVPPGSNQQMRHGKSFDTGGNARRQLGWYW
jgi:hypothetical protein